MEVKRKSAKILPLSKITIKCPTCKKKSILTFAPFCSKKCSNLDLMKWLSFDEFEEK